MTDTPAAAVQDEKATKKAEKAKAPKQKFEAAFCPDFGKILKFAKRFTGKSTNPITGQVRLFLKNGNLWLTATNLDAAFVGLVGKGKGEGQCVIAPEALDDATDIKLDGPKAIIHTADGVELRANIWGDPEEFPKLPEGKSDYWVQPASEEAFLDAITGLTRHCALEKGRYALNGVFIEPIIEQGNHGRLVMCGTDGRRLCVNNVPALISGNTPEAEATLQKHRSIKYQVILPTAAANHAKAMCDLPHPEDAKLSFSFSENTAVFQAGDFTLHTLLVEGQYPDYRSVVPRDLDCHVIVDKAELLLALDKIKKYTSIESQAVRLEFGPKVITLRAKSPVLGEAAIELAVQSTPEVCCVGFDPQYLIQVANSFKGPWLALEFKDKETGAIIHDGHKAEHYGLVMPIDI